MGGVRRLILIGSCYDASLGIWSVFDGRGNHPIICVSYAETEQDANVLGSLLARSTRSTLNQALAVYDKVRSAEGRRIILGSRQMGFLFEMNGPSNLRSDMRALGKEIEKRTGWISASSPEDDVRKAVDLFRQRVSLG